MKRKFITMITLISLSGAFAQNEAVRDSIDSGVNLDEVVVVAKRPTTKFTEIGLVYDLQADATAKTKSLLEALRSVPMVTVTADDEIRVKGSAKYAIYLNGRPYRIAQSDPKSVLNSIPANSVAKIELITELDGRYDAEAGTAIINIITSKNALDGYSLTLNSRMNSSPERKRLIDETNDGISLLASKGKVNMMAGYNYLWKNVLNQPMRSKFTFYNPSGEAIRESATRLLGTEGDFFYHTGRLMLEWTPDSLNSLYVDGHAFFDHHYNDAVLQMTDGEVGSMPDVSYSRSYRSSTSGTAEANIIYRNYYRNNSDLCRFSLGYRFALDPEKAKSDFTVSDHTECIDGVRMKSYVDGHLSEHTINADYALPLSKGHTIRLGAKEIIRIGKTRPTYLIHEDGGWKPSVNDSEHYDGAMDYSQNISALYAAYNGSFKKFNLAASIRGEYARNSFDLLGDDERYGYDYFDVIPRLSLTYNRSETLRYTLTLNTSVTRPGIGQLDPFINNVYTNLQSQGNPGLRQSRTHSVSATMLKMSQRFIVQVSASANRENNPIVDCYYCEPETGNVVMSSANFERHDYLDQSVYVNYNPQNWLSLTLSTGVTENWFKDRRRYKDDFGLSWNFYVGADFSVASTWNMGVQVMGNHIYDDPYTIYTRSLIVPTFYVNKSFFGGKLTVGLSATSPFKKYDHYGNKVTTPEFTKRQNNDILFRSFGLKATYRLSSGKKARIDRDTSLHNDDLSTGVN